MFDDRYEVEREDYKLFIDSFNPEFCRIEEKDNVVKVYSTLSNECLGARVTHNEAPEQYYIFNFPSQEELIPVKPRRKIVLDDIKQIQAFFDGLKAMQEMSNNG